MFDQLNQFIDPMYQKTLLLRATSSAKVPLLSACLPSVIEHSSTRSVVKIPLTFMTKNHVGSMYFGALSMGAELSVAYPVVVEVFQKKQPLTFLFTEFQSRFIKKAKEDIYFVFNGVEELQQLIHQVLSDGGSAVKTFEGNAYLASEWQAEENPVMTYQLGFSLKATGR